MGWCGLGRAPSAGVPGRPVEGTSWCFGSCHLGFCDFICCWSFFCCWGLCQCLALLLVLSGQKLGKEASSLGMFLLPFGAGTDRTW